MTGRIDAGRSEAPASTWRDGLYPARRGRVATVGSRSAAAAFIRSPSRGQNDGYSTAVRVGSNRPVVLREQQLGGRRCRHGATWKPGSRPQVGPRSRRQDEVEDPGVRRLSQERKLDGVGRDHDLIRQS
jgi:hypothetical protein